MQANRTSFFSQQVEFNRPHRLVNTGDTKFCGSLVYEYLDTNERVNVPNIWYNQNYQTRANAIRYDAERQIKQAIMYETNPPYNVNAFMAANIAKRYRERAAKIMSEADRIEASGDPLYPCAASQTELNYGPNVF